MGITTRTIVSGRSAAIALVGLACILFGFVLAYALDPPHDASSNPPIGCGDCHYTGGTPQADWWQGGYVSGDDTPQNRLCMGCHNDASTYNGRTVRMEFTHSSTQTSTTYGNWQLECTDCHNPHYQRQLRMYQSEAFLNTGTLVSLSGNTVTLDTALEEEYEGYLLVPNTQYWMFAYKIENSTEGKTDFNVRGPVRANYVKAGGTYAIVYGRLVDDSIRNKPVKFFRAEGQNSFADGDASRDGVCEVCHTLTSHFTAAGADSDPSHSPMAESDCTVCHNHTDGLFPSGATKCTECHAGSFNHRARVMGQFRGSSHHIQGVDISDAHCYSCHWEANIDGIINTTYHEGYNPDTKQMASGSKVDLVIYGSGTRPVTYASGTTAVSYTADGSRAEMGKINTHCLSCHSDQNNDTQPFGDGKTPRQYSWDGTSVASRYTETGTTSWGKYSGGNVTPKNTQTKAYSAHGNAMTNQRGWNSSETWPDTSGLTNVVCFDCHNSHGSKATGTTTSYASATTNGGILKDTVSGKGGYSVTYTPASGGDIANKSAYNAGGGLCFDCHLNAGTGSTPWGYNDSFGATQAISGYYDSAYFGPATFPSQQKYPYKNALSHAGGHFGASSTLDNAASSGINGLCTPCHDPHGVSPSVGIANMPYAVPLLKGTWLTSPYKEDVAPASTFAGTNRSEGAPYHIDQNTFGSSIRDSVTGITETDEQFAGLCLNCHQKSNLTDGINGGAWKSRDRIHESVKGWGANVKHTYPCSKCHTPHNSMLPRLMRTNCLNTSHKGRVTGNASPALSGSGWGDEWGCYGLATVAGDCWDPYGSWGGSGSGQFPGSYTSAVYGNNPVSCHEGQAPDQSWNVVTPWANYPPAVPALIAEPDTTSTSITLDWNASTDSEGDAVEYYVVVDDNSGFGSINYQSGWQSGTGFSFTAAMDTAYYWRAKARDTYNETGWSTVDDFAVSGGLAPPQVTLSAPADGSPYNTYPVNVSLQWNAVPSVAQYKAEVSTDPAFATVDSTSGWVSGTSWTASIGAAGTYYWRVQARDAVSQTTGPWSVIRYFIANKPPVVPTLIAEPDTTSTSITLDWNATTDPEGNAIEYYVVVDDSSGFGSVDYESGWQSGTSFSFTAATGFRYYWRVKARDTYNESGWSASGNFAVSDGLAPPQVIQVGPINTTTYNYYPRNVYLQWNTATPLSQYNAEVSTDPTFAAVNYTSGWISNTGWYNYLTAAGTYYWRVQARDAVSQTTGPWSETWYFVTNKPPVVPTLIAEPDTTSTSITLDWNATTDPEGNAIEYYVEVDDSFYFTSVDFQSGWQSGTSFSFTAATGFRYYWRVKARDMYNESGWAVRDDFAVSDGLAPPQVTLSSPANTTTYNTYPMNVSLQWNAVPPFVEYDAEVSTDPTFAIINSTSSWISTTSWTASLDSTGTYYWRVQARDLASQTTGPWSETWYFIANKPPVVPTLIAEPDTTSTGITLDWNVTTDPEGNAIEYYTEVDDDPAFVSINYQSGWQSGTSFSFTAANARYYWRVKARDVYNESGWSADDEFDVSSGLAPPQVTLSVPANGALYNDNNPINVSLQWNAAPPVVDYYVQINDAADFLGANNYSSGWISSTSWTSPPLVSGTWYWRVQARDSVSQTTGPWSETGDFVTNMLPTVPVLIAEPDLVCVSNCDITFDWNASTDPDGGPIEYQVQVDNNSNFGSPEYSSAWLSDTSWTVALPSASAWNWRVASRDVLGAVSWSAGDAFMMWTSNRPPAPTLIDRGNYATDCYVSQVVTLQWNPVTDPDGDPVEYYAEVTGVASSGWITATSWNFTAGPAGNYNWRVKARDASHIDAESGWSASDNFYDITDCGGSCPMLYAWDGEKYAFESDLYSRGKLGIKYAFGFLKPIPHDYYLLLNDPEMKDGLYELNLVEERYETNYLDRARLFTIDSPADRKVYPEITFGNDYVDPGTLLHTVDERLMRPLSAVHVNTGEDVSELLARADENYLVFSNDQNEDFDWNTIELDLGDLSLAPQVKLMIHAASGFPTTGTGRARAKQLEINGQRALLEVLDSNGDWVVVPSSVGTLPIPKEFMRPYVFDITNIFQTDDYRVRLSFLYKTHIDAIYFDTTVDEPVTVNEVPFVSASLDSHGFSATTSDTRPYKFIYETSRDVSPLYLPGNYTRFGDVTQLLTDVDDMFAIFGSGDEVKLYFRDAAPQPVGTTRRFLLYTNGYYKSWGNPQIELAVEPLPFAAMSTFPYDTAVENYPADEIHDNYRLQYNTRAQ